MFRAVAVTIAFLFALPLQAQSAPTHGTHDFDWNFGTWSTHIARLVQSPSAKGRWVYYDGVVTVRPLLGGSSNVEEVEADGPTRLQFVAVRTFNAQANQWVLNQADSSSAFGQIAFGAFSGGRGTFYDVESYDNRTVMVRQSFFDITPTSYAFEQALSSDGGRTWVANFRARLHRTSSSVVTESGGSELSHDFDFNYGTWRTDIRYLRNALTAPTWATQTGTVTLHRLWRGRGMLEEIVTQGNDAFSGITLYLYDSRAREWSQTYIDGSDGTRDPSMVGRFSNNRAELLSQATSGHALVVQRGVWSNISANSHRFEIDSSKDGGASWQPFFIAHLTRIGTGA